MISHNVTSGQLDQKQTSFNHSVSFLLDPFKRPDHDNRQQLRPVLLSLNNTSRHNGPPPSRPPCLPADPVSRPPHEPAPALLDHPPISKHRPSSRQRQHDRQTARRHRRQLLQQRESCRQGPCRGYLWYVPRISAINSLREELCLGGNTPTHIHLFSLSKQRTQCSREVCPLTTCRSMAPPVNLRRRSLRDPRVHQRLQPLERALGALGASAPARRTRGVPLPEHQDEELLLGRR